MIPQQQLESEIADALAKIPQPPSRLKARGRLEWYSRKVRVAQRQWLKAVSDCGLDSLKALVLQRVLEKLEHERDTEAVFVSGEGG